MADAIYKQSLDEVRTRIADLDLSGVNDASIVVRKLPEDERRWQHGITVSWGQPKYGTIGSNLRSTACRDMVGYPCYVTIVEGTGRGWTDQLNRLATRAQKIRREFHLKRLSTVTATDVNHVICKVTNGAITASDEYLRNHDVTQLIVWCWFLEPRTN